jgi:hypothetical protein
MRAHISTIHDFFSWYLGNTKFVGQDNQHWPSVGWQNFFQFVHLSVNGRYYEDVGDVDTVAPLLYNFLKESRFNDLTFVINKLDNVYEIHFAIHGVAFSIDSVDQPNF